MANVRSIYSSFFECALTVRSNRRSNVRSNMHSNVRSNMRSNVRSNMHFPWYPPGLTGTFLQRLSGTTGGLLQRYFSLENIQ